MRKYGIFSLLFAVLMLFIGCAQSSTTLREQGDLRGRIFVIGNDPFTKLALALDDQSSIVLLCPPEVEHYLRSHQGSLTKVTYDGTSWVPEGQAVRVTSAETVKE